MAVKGTFPIRVESNLQGLGCVLKSAVCEWLLLFLLLLNAAFSYFLTKFAQYFELQLPCPLCSRLDHVLGKEKPDFYKNLLCCDHKSEISSLVLCHDHHKLADIHGMCEECLLSFAKKETNEETYKLLVGKLGPECLQKPFLSMDSAPGSLMTRPCSCCSKQWKTRPHVQKLLHSKPPASISKPDIPLPKSPRYRCLNRQDGLKKRKDRFSVSTTPFVLGNMDYDLFSRMGYTEVKITSDSDSDFPLSDDDDIIPAPRDPQSSNGENLFRQSPEFLPNKQTPQILTSTHTTSILIRPDLEPEKGETTTPTFFVRKGNVPHSLPDINWQQMHKKTIPEIPELTSLDDIPLLSSVSEISAIISTNEADGSSLSKLSSSGLTDSHKTASMFSNITLRNISLPVNVQYSVNQSKDDLFDTKGKGNIEHASLANNWESIDLNGTTTVMEVDTGPIRKNAAIMTRSFSDSVPRNLASSISNDVSTAGFLLEHQRRDANVTELTEEKTAASCSNSSFDKNPAEKNPMIESRTLSNIPTIERSPSVESQEGSVGEIECENLVDRLRREIEHGKKRISDLYKELDEERSAAAIAANQAMAMITKLQEEKAALHMEALQYLRMMEEQAEYDVDELEKANDMIAEKEKEIQDLEAELDYFRLKYPEEFPEYSDSIGLDLEDVQSSLAETAEPEKS